MLFPRAILFVTACLLMGVHAYADGPNQPINPGKRDQALAPDPATVRAPDSEQMKIKRDSALQEKRTPLLDKAFDKKESPLKDKKSSIDLKEARTKPMFPVKVIEEKKTEMKMSPLNHREALGGAFDRRDKPMRVARFEESLHSAQQVQLNSHYSNIKPLTLQQLNRFVYKRNGDAAPPSTAAGSEKKS